MPGFLGFHDVECEVGGGLATATLKGFAQITKSGEGIFVRVVSLPMRSMREPDRSHMTRFFPVTEVFLGCRVPAPWGKGKKECAPCQPSKGSMGHSVISDIFEEVSWFFQSRPLGLLPAAEDQ
jgi:hypothetical protein